MKQVNWKTAAGDKIVCYCANVSKQTIIDAIKAKVNANNKSIADITIADIQNATGAGLGNRCRELNPSGHCCHGDIRELIKIYGAITGDNDKA